MPTNTKFTQRNVAAGRTSASLDNPYAKSKDYLSLSTGTVKKEKTPSKMPKTPSASVTSTTVVVKPATTASANKVKEAKAANKLKKIEARGNKRADVIAGTRERKKMNPERIAAMTGALGGVLTVFDQAKKSLSKKPKNDGE
jgi:hypothetical protein